MRHICAFINSLQVLHRGQCAFFLENTAGKDNHKYSQGVGAGLRGIGIPLEADTSTLKI